MYDRGRFLVVDAPADDRIFAVAGAFGDETPLEVGDGTEDVEHQLAGSGRGVEALLEADQVDAAGLTRGTATGRAPCLPGKTRKPA